MSGEKELLLSLPLDNKEREWMEERLRTLSVREEYQLAAAVWQAIQIGQPGQGRKTGICTAAKAGGSRAGGSQLPVIAGGV